MNNTLSITIITLNEEKNIERCLKSVSFADEIIIVDSGSTDRTVEISRKLGCKVYSADWQGFGKAKQEAVNYAAGDWVLSLDADEELSPELIDTIKKIVAAPVEMDGYRIKRISYYLDRPIRYSGWQRDYPLRLFRRNKGHFNDKIVHESIQVDGNIGKIHAPLMHYTYPNINSHVEKIIRYSELAAKQESQKKSGILMALSKGIAKFIKMYLINLGFLDGKEGFILAWISAFGVSLKYFKIWEIKSKS